MVYFPLLLCAYVLALSLEPGMAGNTASVHVGVVLDTGTPLGKMSSAAMSFAIEDFYAVHQNYTTRLVIHTRDSEEGEAGAAWAAFDLLRNARVQAILGPATSAQAELVADFGNKAQIPVISFSATSPSLSPAEKPYFVRTALHDAHQVNAISSIISHFGWRAAVPLCEGTSHGSALMPHLVDTLHAAGIRVPHQSLISPAATDEQIEKELHRLMNMQISVFIAHMPPSLGSRLFVKAREVGLMGHGYVWIVTDSMTNFVDHLDPVIVHSMHGLLGVRPHVPNTEELHSFKARMRAKPQEENPGTKPMDVNIFGLWAYDAVWALARAVEKVGVGSQISDNSTARFGRRLLEEVSNDKFSGKSGEIHMVGGQLKPSSFQIVNVAGKRPRNIGVWSWSPTHDVSSLGLSGINNNNDKTPSSLVMGQEKISWPGDSTGHASRGWELLASGKKKLRIAVPSRTGFEQLVSVKSDRVTNTTVISGYCIDVFDTVMKQSLPFSVDYEYVPLEIGGTSTTSTYNDLINQVFFRKYDAVVGDTTIMSNRSFFVDFTLPYTETGVWMLVRTERDRNSNGWVFLKPLRLDLWLASLAFFCFTGFAVWAIEQRINLAFRGPPCEQFGTIFYFTFSTLVFAHKEGLQNNLSRFVVIVWVFVVLILSSSYTASLTSMLTVEQFQAPSVADLQRNGDHVGYQHGSFVEQLLRQLNFDRSRLRAYNNRQGYEDALLRGSHDGGVAAVVDEMPYIRDFLKQRCTEYGIFGPISDSKGFGFVFPRGSPLVADVSRAILNATEMNKLIPVERKWFGDQTTCSSTSTAITSNTLTLNSFTGLFTISGVVSAVSLLFFIGRYICENWDELRTMSLGSPLRKRIVAWVRHYRQLDPRGLKKGAYDCQAMNTAAVGSAVEFMTTVADDATGTQLQCESSPVEAGRPEGRPSTATLLDGSDTTPRSTNHSPFELN